eukprot:9278877-Lingulodinium_polyedra.AAC.1
MGSYVVAQRRRLRVPPSPILRKSRRRGPRWPARGAVIVLPQTSAQVTLRAHSGTPHPDSTRESHLWPTRSKALAWSAK